MQRKLAESEIEKLKQARAAISDVLFPAYGDHGRYWAEVLFSLDDKIRHGTSDGKPRVEPWFEPEIPEGYRKAEPGEWRRKDVKYWHTEKNSWTPRFLQGIPLQPGKTYIVPFDQPLTDRDAAQWPRPLVMARDEDRHPWIGPYKYLGKAGSSYAIDPDNSGDATCWNQARRATPGEIEAAARK